MNLLIFNINTDLDHPTQAFTTSWINGLAGHSEKVFVLSLSKGRLNVRDNVQVSSCGKERGFSRPRQVLEFYRALFSILRANRIDACFAHMAPLFAVMGWPLLAMRRIPILLWYGHRATPLLLKLAHLLVDGVVTSSPNAFRLRSHKVQVIGQGVDTERFVPKTIGGNDGPFVAVSVGRLSPIKNLQTLIDAIPLLARELGGRKILVRLIGKPGTNEQQRYETLLKDQVQRLQLEDIVRFEGAIPYERVHEVYDGAHASYNGCPTGAPDKAVLEGMSAGIPPVTPNESFIPILGRAYEWLVAPAATPPHVAERLLRIAKLTAPERERMARDLRTTVVEYHSVKHATDEIMRILERTVAHKMRPAV